MVSQQSASQGAVPDRSRSRSRYGKGTASLGGASSVPGFTLIVVQTLTSLIISPVPARAASPITSSGSSGRHLSHLLGKLVGKHTVHERLDVLLEACHRRSWLDRRRSTALGQWDRRPHRGLVLGRRSPGASRASRKASRSQKVRSGSWLHADSWSQVHIHSNFHLCSFEVRKKCV